MAISILYDRLLVKALWQTQVPVSPPNTGTEACFLAE